MLRKLLSRAAALFGYDLVLTRKGRGGASPYFLHDYKRPDGTFDYERYRKIQEAGNIQKINAVWVLEENIEFLSHYLQRHLGSVKFGLCHGTRRGVEQGAFRKFLGAEVIGTEISQTAADFPHTIQWDFHDVKPEWLNAVDFIYSNSFDHSYDPERCLNAWMSCVRKGGVCILEHTSSHEPKGANELDPFGADLMVMPYLITRWAKGAYFVREILDAPRKRENVTFTSFIVIEKR